MADVGDGSEPIPTENLAGARDCSAPSKARCLGCGYLLRGLPAPRCPECGRSFDPAIAKTMSLPGGANSFLSRPLPDGAGLITAAASTLALCMVGRYSPAAIVGTLLGITVLARIGVEVRRAKDRKIIERPAGWTLSLLLLCLAFISAMHYHQCPHIRAMGIGNVGLGYSDNGGPCHNLPLDGGTYLVGNWYLVWFDGI